MRGVVQKPGDPHGIGPHPFESSPIAASSATGAHCTAPCPLNRTESAHKGLIASLVAASLAEIASPVSWYQSMSIRVVGVASAVIIAATSSVVLLINTKGRETLEAAWIRMGPRIPS